MADCGACNLCCKLLYIEALAKPAQMLCWNTGLHGGCKVQHLKKTDPTLDVCAGFACIWLQSQSFEDESLRGSRMMRPDQSHVMFVRDSVDAKLLWVHVDPAHRDAWRSPHVAAYLDEVASKGGKFHIIVGEDHFPWPEKEVVEAA
jgi:hypothetical protein